MIVGVPKELKDGENRVGLDPKHVKRLIAESGVLVVVESGAGDGAGFHDDDYVEAGAFIVQDHSVVYGVSHMIVKVKEVLVSEYPLVKGGQAIAGYFHLPANPDLQRLITGKQLKTLVYEDIVDEQGRRPALAPMSIIAGEAGATKALQYLRERRGESLDLATVRATVVGKGNVGRAAIGILLAGGILPQNIHILEKDSRFVDFNSEFVEAICSEDAMRWALERSDILIGAAASRKKEAPKVVTRAMLRTMRAGSVFVDVAVDEGGISETTRHTSHSDPTFEECGVLHYCVPNIPGAYPKRATYDLSAAAYPYILAFIREMLAEGGRVEHTGMPLGPEIIY